MEMQINAEISVNIRKLEAEEAYTWLVKKTGMRMLGKGKAIKLYQRDYKTTDSTNEEAN